MEADAWYSGVDAKLTAFYGGVDTSSNQTRRRRFWARTNTDAQGRPTDRQRLHVPAAADIAATSADLLFGQTPTFESADDDTDDAIARLEELGDDDNWGAVFVESAEIAAALGGVYLHPVWDTSVADHPMLAIEHPDCAVPEFKWGRLTAVTFWHVVSTDSRDGVVRHLERHETDSNGQPIIIHGLFAGTQDALGQKIPLATVPAYDNLDTDDEGIVHLPAGLTPLDVSYVKNVGPNRQHRQIPIGRSDWQGCEDLMDALDETYTSWMRDIRLSKARLLVPESYLDRRPGRGQGASFDMDEEVFAPLGIEPNAGGDKLAIEANQFNIRFAEHAATAAALFERIVVTAGYSPQSFGLQGDGSDQTATEVTARSGKSDRTVDRKRRYWEQALADQAAWQLVIDKAVFKGKTTPIRPRIVWPTDPDQTPLQQANSLAYLAQAKAASTRVLVEMLHPDWTDDELDAETAAIRSENAMIVPDPDRLVVTPTDADDGAPAEPEPSTAPVAE